METKKVEKQKKWFLIPPHPLTNFEIQKYYQNDPWFNGVYSRDNLPKIKDMGCVVNLDECSDVGTYWAVLYDHRDDATYFDSLGLEHIPKEIKALVKNKNIKTNIFIIQAYDSIWH